MSHFFSRDDLEKIINRHSARKNLSEIEIKDSITNRYYQKEAIKTVCERIQQGFRKNLLVMATGTGKTRTAASLVDVLIRAKYISNTLFLADRTELVKQAKNDTFTRLLTDLSTCNLCIDKENLNARVVFSTYQTMINFLDEFSPAHFDLIIIDESHRSIFKKYRAIFDYFDSLLVGLTATPRDEVDRSTYDFFDTARDRPTYEYSYDKALTDGVLVPYKTLEVCTKFLTEGIKYDELSEQDKERYEEDFFNEDGSMPEFIPPQDLNDFIFNENTCDIVIDDLLKNGIYTDSGVRLGKTIIFAQNIEHANFIVKRFNAKNPEFNGEFARTIRCQDLLAHELIEKFKSQESNPFIIVSVDMMDTGIDVESCLNLVFFKRVRSKIKFWQMIGRGTRLCENIACFEKSTGEYFGKKRFMIFDYCGNFEFFRANPEGIINTGNYKTLDEQITDKKNYLLELLGCHEEYKNFCEGLSREESDNNYLAKRFDNFIYGLMIAELEGSNKIEILQKNLQSVAASLMERENIAQVQEKISLLNEIIESKHFDVLTLESIRQNLRGLINILADNFEAKKVIITNLNDDILDSLINDPLPSPKEKAKPANIQDVKNLLMSCSDPKQQEFFIKLINYIKKNGYITSKKILVDICYPEKFMNLFSDETRKKILELFSHCYS